MQLLRLVFALFVFFAVTPAGAQGWEGTIQKDDFGDKDTGIALVESSGRGFGLRCIKGEEPALIFLTREQWVEGLAILPAKLLIRVDENEPFSLAADLESYDGGNAFRQAELVRVVADEGPFSTILDQIEAAKGKISVALELGDQRFEPTRFGSRGSGKALAKVRPLCSLGSP